MEHEFGTRLDYAKYRLACAKEYLQDAETLLDGERFKSANNRAYYAIFHAVNAVHSLCGEGYKRHREALGNFNKNFVHTGIFPKEIGHELKHAEKIRSDSDYDIFYCKSCEAGSETRRKLAFVRVSGLPNATSMSM